MDERDRPQFGRARPRPRESVYQNNLDDDDFDAEAFISGDSALRETTNLRMIGILVTGVAFLFMPFVMLKVAGILLLGAGLFGMFGKGETFERIRTEAMFGQLRLDIGVVIIGMGLIFMISNSMVGSKVMEEAERARVEALQDRQGN